ncbi:pyruvate carboxylase subunit B [bacterium]|nr:pyruvate carboxylase subunit B [bacterium]
MTQEKHTIAGKARKQTIQLRITDTTLRDAHQSLWATRLRTKDIMEIIDRIDSVGYYSLEMWGGATFDVCLRFLRENPWERLRMIKSRSRHTPLQMLLRGQNIVGYKNYADDLLDRFIALACHNGIDIFRVFDALNDTRNLEYAIKAIKRYGGHAQGTLSYTISPFHTIENYVKAARDQVELGIDTLCIKDMAGMLSPIAAEKLVTALTKEINVPIQLHCHLSSGMATATYVEGVRAGAGAIDCAISPMAGFSSQPPVETMVSIFSETDYDTKIDLGALREISRFFENLAPKMRPGHQPASIIDPDILIHQIPGGMISNLRSQLDQQKALDRLNEVLAEVPQVRADLGYPPLVTPTSQIVGTQAVLNILSGERYKIIPNEIKNYLRGLYGRPPAPIDPKFIKKILGTEKPITHRPADDIPPMLPTAIENLDSRLIEHEEDIISYCLFPEPALEYFRWRSLPPKERPETPADLELKVREEFTKTPETAAPPMPPQYVKVGTGATFLSHEDYSGINEILKTVNLLGIKELVIRKNEESIVLKSDTSGKPSDEMPLSAETGSPGIQSPAAAVPEHENPAPDDESAFTTINSPLVGQFYSSPAPGKPPFVNPGDSVKAGVTVCIVEAMKLINEIKAPADCKIIRMLEKNGAKVEKGQPLVAIDELKTDEK